LPPPQASSLLQTWEKDSVRVCDALEREQNHWATTKRDSKPAPDNPYTLRLEVSSAAEVDEVFGALGKGRMVGQEISRAVREMMREKKTSPWRNDQKIR
jgi:hypothetical protein